MQGNSAVMVNRKLHITIEKSKVIDYAHKGSKKYLLSMLIVYMFVHIKSS